MAHPHVRSLHTETKHEATPPILRSRVDTNTIVTPERHKLNLDKDLFTRDLYAKETINVARTESETLIVNVTDKDRAPTPIKSTVNPFVLVSNPVQPTNSDKSRSRSGTDLQILYFRDANEFLGNLRQFLRTADSVQFWIDVDLTHMSKTQQAEFFHLFRLNQITQNDCLSEDRLVSDTRMALYERYLFCIVDTVENIIGEDSQHNHRCMTRNLNVMVFEAGVLSVHLGGIDVSETVISRINAGHGVIPSCGWLVWCLFDVMTDAMNRMLDASVATTDRIDHECVNYNAFEKDARPDEHDVHRPGHFLLEMGQVKILFSGSTT